MSNNFNLEKTVQSISTLTGKTIDEVQEFMNGQLIKYSDVLNYAIYFERLPDEKEVAFICNFGIDHFLNLKGIAV